MKRPFPLYHWSPVERRNSIIRLGLVPNKLSKCKQWRPPYICFSDSPSLAWGLSAETSDIYGDWDLWMMWSNEPKGYETLTTGYNRSKKPTEYRVYERVYKRQIWYVGSRQRKQREPSSLLTHVSFPHIERELQQVENAVYGK